MYMFGGTDDANELNDFWVYDTTKNEWMIIECSNGPSPRSGCKMVFDPMGNQLFILGRKSSRGSDNLKVIKAPLKAPLIDINFLLITRVTFICSTSHDALGS